LHELRRGGQVFFVHNRVETIELIHRRLSELIPEARFLVAHGQMEPELLERTLVAFVQGEANVLICSTIVESGVDMPNVNTILVNRADQLGLAQLYQLRGRVGRSARQAASPRLSAASPLCPIASWGFVVGAVAAQPTSSRGTTSRRRRIIAGRPP
jgi:transcription-repair coupling factor (superfamily II helicase)